MELKDTVEMMNSRDYQERFKAEYVQTEIRHRKLSKLIDDYEAGVLNFKPKCSLELLQKQYCAMQEYICALEVRAVIEEIALPRVPYE